MSFDVTVYVWGSEGKISRIQHHWEWLFVCVFFLVWHACLCLFIDDKPAHQQDGLCRILPHPTAEESAIHSWSRDHCRPHVSLHSEQIGLLQCGFGPSTGLRHRTTTACLECGSQTYQRSTSTRYVTPALQDLHSLPILHHITYKLCVGLAYASGAYKHQPIVFVWSCDGHSEHAVLEVTQICRHKSLRTAQHLN